MIKLLLELWATATNNDEVRSSAFDGARKFVLDGDESWYNSFVRIDSRVPPIDNIRLEAFGAMPNVISTNSDSQGRAWGNSRFTIL